LSYTWGDPNVTKPLIVGDAQREVTANLDAALRQLQSHHDGKPRTAWINAISINQKGNVERRVGEFR
jgi:hypothetical protein